LYTLRKTFCCTLTGASLVGDRAGLETGTDDCWFQRAVHPVNSELACTQSKT